MGVGGWEGGGVGGGGSWGAIGRLKHPFIHTQRAVLCLQYVT